jgi:hypothetical protein
MVLIVVLAVLGIWMVLSAVLLLGVCIAASRYNQAAGKSDESYPERDPELNLSSSTSLSMAADRPASPTTPRRRISKETG